MTNSRFVFEIFNKILLGVLRILLSICGYQKIMKNLAIS